MTTTWAINRPRGGPNGRVTFNVRLLITDVPEEVTAKEVLAWVDDHDDQLDYATREENWGSSLQLSAEGAPTVQWRRTS